MYTPKQKDDNIDERIRANKAAPRRIRPSSTAHQEGIVAIGRMNHNDSSAKAAAHDPSSRFCKWAYDIANDVQYLHEVGIEKAIGAFKTWGVKMPYNLFSKAIRLGILKEGSEWK